MAMRDKEGRTLANAHLLGFLWRILKLLFYGVKPVFVFDGGAPALKRRTLASRKTQRHTAKESHARVAEKLLAAQMRQAALAHVASRDAERAPVHDTDGVATDEGLEEGTVYYDTVGRTNAPQITGRGSDIAHGASPSREDAQRREQEEAARRKRRNQWHKDPYQLPEIPAESHEKPSKKKDFRFATEEEMRAMVNSLAPEDLDMNSELFRSLPQELQYELVGDLRAQSRGTSFKRLQAMLASAPTPIDFSRAQIAGVKTRNDLTQKVLTVTDEIGSANIQVPLRVAGARNREYVLIRNPTGDGGFALALRDAGATQDKAIVVDDEEGEGNEPGDHDTPIQVPDDDEDEIAMEDVEIPDATAQHVSDPQLDELVQQEQNPLRRKERAVALLRTRAEQHVRQMRNEAGIDALEERLYGRPEAVSESSAGLFHDEVPVVVSDEEEEPRRDESIPKPPSLGMRLRDRPGEPVSLNAALRRKGALDRPRPQRTPVDSGVSMAQPGPSRAAADTAVGAARREAPALVEPEDAEPEEGLEFEDVEIGAPGQASESPVQQEPAEEPVHEPTPEPTPEEPAPQTVAQATEEETDKGPVSEETELTGSPTKDGPVSAAEPTDAELTLETESRPGPTNVQEPEAKPDATEAAVSNEKIVDRQATPPSIPEKDKAVSPPLPPQSPTLKEPTLDAVPPSSAEATPPKPVHDTPPPQGTALSASPVAVPKSPSPARYIKPEPDAELLEQAKQPDAVELFPRKDPEPKESFAPQETAALDTDEKGDAEARPASPAPSSPRSGPATPLEWSPSPRGSPEPVPLGPDGFPIASSAEVAEAEEQEASDLAQIQGDQANFASFVSSTSGRSLGEMQAEVEAEVEALRTDHARTRRSEEDITRQMSIEIQSLLRLFGLPYITAPMEAEAQCAELSARKLVDGIITDDSDVFLFGGTPVYRNMFNNRRMVECFFLSDVERELGLDRERLIQLALLLGSDYTEGLPGVGPVLAMEILSLYPGKDSLQQFREWWRQVQVGSEQDTNDRLAKTRKRIKRALRERVHLSEDWPDPAVKIAYTQADVDQSDEPFAWGHADLDAIRSFLGEYLKWPTAKTDQYVLPVIEQQRKAARLHRIQSTLDQSGFGTGQLRSAAALGNVSGGHVGYGSTRLQQVVNDFRSANRAQAEQPAPDIDSHTQGDAQPQPPPRKRSRKKSAPAQDSSPSPDDDEEYRPTGKRRASRSRGRAASQAANRAAGRRSRLTPAPGEEP